MNEGIISKHIAKKNFVSGSFPKVKRVGSLEEVKRPESKPVVPSPVSEDRPESRIEKKRDWVNFEDEDEEEPAFY